MPATSLFPARPGSAAHTDKPKKTGCLNTPLKKGCCVCCCLAVIAVAIVVAIAVAIGTGRRNELRHIDVEVVVARLFYRRAPALQDRQHGCRSLTVALDAHGQHH